jgi:hypothetical protein
MASGDLWCRFLARISVLDDVHVWQSADTASIVLSDCVCQGLLTAPMYSDPLGAQGGLV